MIAARQLKGVVFLHEIYDVRPTPKTPQENKKEKRTLANRRKRAYIRAKLDQHLTIITDKENTKPYIPTSPDPVFNWTAVNTFEMTDETTGKTHRLLTGSTCSAVDESGKCVQIMPFRSKSSPKTPKELASWHTFANLQPRWYMHALFSDQYRVIGGVYHQTTNELMQLVDMNASEWLENREGWELDVCLVYLFDILTQIRVALSKMPDDTMFIVQRAKQSSEFKITPLQTNEQAEFEFMNKKFKDLAFPQSSTPAKWR
ncbi:hypothetical protein M3Y94_00083500 [Aphelenchoides besseyi]|nr:hypothetical protein M3Y94_00083500 [Aphelenchoides besseyi]